MKPDISFVIPAHNAEAWIAEAIGSCVGQSAKRLEIIVVCNGCTDHTRHVADWYAKKDNRLRVFGLTDANRGAARNFGIRRAEADIVAMLDADDMASQDRAKETLRAFSANGAQWLCSGADIIGALSNSEAIARPGKPVLEKLIETKFAGVIHSTMAMRRELCLKYPYDEGEYQAIGLDDWHLQARLLNDGIDLVYIEKSLAGLRERKSSTVAMRDEKTVAILKDKFLGEFRATKTIT